jgi:hypothetical protein
MAIDNTPPRLKLIATIAIITVVTLISLDFVFRSYYAMMSDEAHREKVAPTTEKDEQHKAEHAALTGAQIPLEAAMEQLGKGNRPEPITPQASEDLAPLTGWSKLPKQAPTPTPHVPPPPPPLPAVAGDAGAAPAAAAADAGAAPPPKPHAAPDAGAHHD